MKMNLNMDDYLREVDSKKIRELEKWDWEVPIPVTLKKALTRNFYNPSFESRNSFRSQLFFLNL